MINQVGTLMRVTSVFSLKEYLSIAGGHLLCRPRHDDCFLVSYPRSGNTWMRNMLAFVLNPEQSGNPDYTRAKIPGVSIRNSWKINRLSSPRLIKSHTWYRSQLPKVLYLMRDGRDVVVSLYHYYITREGQQKTFEQFILDYLDGKYGQIWHDHISGWLISGKQRLGNNFLGIRFEEMKDNPVLALQDAVEFLSISADPGRLKKAVELSNLTRMRKIENQRRGSVENINQSFYRGGRSGDWSDYFSASLMEKFMEAVGNDLRLAGYH